ncbi:MAG: GTP-binding protein [Candidatus Helarchaeota archaeon]|nr:GTP-binding protein [Candidatus Helarchaeota archaeon]
MEESATFKWKIVVIGDPFVGKTTLMLRYTQKKFRELYIPTVGVQVSRKIVKINNIHCSLNIWDIAGQQKFSNVRKMFYEGADAVIIVFDVTDKPSFVNSSTWYNDFLSFNKDNFGILLGNKIDLEQKRVILYDWGQILSNKMAFQYFETSAKTGKNVEDLFAYIAITLLKTAREKEVK